MGQAPNLNSLIVFLPERGNRVEAQDGDLTASLGQAAP
jgi:hypothetical protein